MGLTAERLREVLRYDSETGHFFWKKKMSSRAMPGQKAGALTVYGYIQIRIDGVIHRAHRLAWLYLTGENPTGQIDHINRKRDDNRATNLRDVTATVNRQNIGLDSRKNRTGFLGVTAHKQGAIYQGQIHVNGERVSLGYFKTAAEAHEAYLRAKRAYHPGCTI